MIRTAQTIVILCILSVWQGLSSLNVIPAYKFPSPIEILSGIKELAMTGTPPGQRLLNHVLFSLYRVGIGYALACAIAVPVGLLMGWSRRLYTIGNPILELVRPIPPLAWIPIAILWFGIGIKSAAFIIFLGAFFPILLNTVSGVVRLNTVLIEAARTLHAKESDIFLKVLLPGSVPSIFTGMRIGVGIGWMTLVAAEYTGVKEGFGLGYMIMTARDLQRPDLILAGMLVIGLIGLLIDVFLRFVESKVIRWQ